jgi:DNA-binding beta-propeller fold protein YncE
LRFAFTAALVALAVVATALAAPARADLLVASSGTDSVLRYDATTGAFRGAFVAAGAGGLDQPRGLATGPDGALYVASFFTDQVLRYDGDTGAFLGVFVAAGSGGLDGPTYLVFGPDADLYVGSFFTDEVLRYDGTTGASLGAFVAAGSGGLHPPAGLVFGADTNLYVSSGISDEVLRYDGTTGAFQSAFVGAGSGGLDGPSGLVFAPGGDLLVASALSGSVLRYDATSGAFVGAFVAAGSGGLATPLGLALGSDGHLYVGSNGPDPGTDGVLRYDATSGAFVDAFVPGGAGGLDGPFGLLFADLPPPPLGPFLCYKARTARRTPRFTARSAALAGGFEDTTAAVKKPAALCNPADVAGAGIADEDTHLESYAMRPGEKAAKQKGLAVSDALGSLVLDALKPDRLRLPSAKDLAAPVDPLADPPLDAYECYKAKVSKGTPKLPKGTQVTVADQFESERTLDVKKPSRLCVPVGVDGAAVLHPEAFALCYRVKPARGEPRHTRRTGVHTANAFGAEQLDTVKEDELCLPAVVAVPQARPPRRSRLTGNGPRAP